MFKKVNNTRAGTGLFFHNCAVPVIVVDRSKIKAQEIENQIN